MSEKMKDKNTYYLSRAFFSSIGMSLIFTNCLTSFWISEILGIIISVIILYFIRPNNTKILKIIVGFLMSLISMIILVNMGHTLYLNETPIFVLSLLPVIAVYILSKCEKKAFNKIGAIFFVCSIVLFALKILGLSPHFMVDNLKPYGLVGIKEIILGTLIFVSISITPIIYLDESNNRHELIKNYLISAFTTLVVSILAMGVLGLKEVILYRNPEYIVLKKISILDFVNNVDNFFNFAILLDLLFTSSIGIRAVSTKTRESNFILCMLLLIGTSIATRNNNIVVFIYYNLPYIFIVLLIIQLFLSIIKYKFLKKL